MLVAVVVVGLLCVVVVYPIVAVVIIMDTSLILVQYMLRVIRYYL